MRGDGDGWAVSPGGVRHWGKFGAAGLLLRAPIGAGGVAVLLQHRAPWSHQGGTWALPGGARDSDETAVHAAVREADEEAGIKAADIQVRAERVTAVAPSGWTYTTVIADAGKPLPVEPNMESVELAWVPEHEVDQRPLHAAFAAAWPDLRATPARMDTGECPQTDIADLAATLPRTVDLGAEFVWLHADPEGPGERAVLLNPPYPAERADDSEVAAAVSAAGDPAAEPGAAVQAAARVLGIPRSRVLGPEA
ncbi:NUDIX domain-containing protein [Nocardia flavorosea]|uniref:NUDIX domain-containing protein n=1 Tax=Nocardia flavorosea TaxID=53429 RepID=A0A846YFB5_9NOCA|nr:NUDIX hydrolase [Nocardia flavorosea]NKY56420.1 NUDIX domain-containing protein [Nocardia flavorosea]